MNIQSTIIFLTVDSRGCDANEMAFQEDMNISLRDNNLN